VEHLAKRDRATALKHGTDHWAGMLKSLTKAGFLDDR
jgi:hypothetical protein